MSQMNENDSERTGPLQGGGGQTVPSGVATALISHVSLEASALRRPSSRRRCAAISSGEMVAAVDGTSERNPQKTAVHQEELD